MLGGADVARECTVLSIKEQRQQLLAAATVWDGGTGRRRTDAAIGNLLRAVAQQPAHREPTHHERMVLDAALELADAVLGAAQEPAGHDTAAHA